MEITTRCGVISKHNILTQVNINDTDTALPVQHTVMCVSFCRTAILLVPLLCFSPFHPAGVLHLPESTWMQHYLHLPFVATIFFSPPSSIKLFATFSDFMGFHQAAFMHKIKNVHKNRVMETQRASSQEVKHPNSRAMISKVVL